MSTRERIMAIGIAAVLLSIILAGLLWLSTAPSAGLTLSYAAGLSMIFLPCTLPLAFIIVPLTMGEAPRKGLLMAVLFGLGVSLTLSAYGAVTALIGQYLGLDQLTRIMFAIAGTAAFLFGLSELKLVAFTLPGFSGAIPTWMQQRQDYLRVLLMGLFLGNAGVGCPNPAFYVLLGYIATVGDIGTGWLLGLVHGIGRATPLILLAILGMVGVNVTGLLVSKKKLVDSIMGWALVAIGSFILTYGSFGMPWWEGSVFHASWNQLVYTIAPQLAEAPSHPAAKGLFVVPFWAGWVLFPGLIGVSVVWATIKKLLSKTKAVFIVSIILVFMLLAATETIKAEYEHGVDDVPDRGVGMLNLAERK